MNVRARPRIVVLGRLTTMPFAGVVWQYLHYLLGLERLGFEPWYVEAHAVAPRHFIRDRGDDGAAAASAYLAGVADRFGFAGRWAFHSLASDGRCYGLEEGRLRELYRSAAAILNLHGGTVPRPEHRASQRLICICTDPVQIELELHRRVPETLAFFAAHDVLFSFAENYGHADCKLPVSPEFPILPTRQPVVLDLWRGRGEPARPAFTTVANWRHQRSLDYHGETYEWSKHFEFLKLLDRPRRASQPLELALARCPPEDRAALLAHGWSVRDAVELSSDIDAYRRYVATSRGELTVAKDQNVRLRTGWFSDRSATYLAAGRPVVTQDTAFGCALPTGAGLFAFSTPDAALGALQLIDADYPRHSRAALQIAADFFAHDAVLPSLLERGGVEMPRPAGKRPARTRQRVLLVAHRFPPDAMGGVERYTEELAESLQAAGSAVAVVSRRPGQGPLRREVESLPSGVRVHRLAGGRFSRDQFLLDHDGLERLFSEALEESDPEIVHFNHLIDLAPASLRQARERGAAVVLTLHDYYFACPRILLLTTEDTACAGPRGGRACAETCFPDTPAERWALRTAYFRRLLGLADRVVCPSRHVADFFAGFGAPAERLRVVPNGIWLDRVAETNGWVGPRQRGRLALAFLGAVLPHKGVQVVIEALERAALPAVELTAFGTIGDPDWARFLYARAAAVPGLSFRMYGEYAPEELPLLLGDIDAVVVPSQWPETYCLVAYESLARGIPAVVSRQGALPDAVRDEQNGFVFEDTEQLAAILGRLSTEEDLLPRLRAGARSTPTFTQAEHVAGLQAIYREAVEEARRRGAPAPSDLDEIEALERALESVGFAGDTEVLVR